jgi:hypothetical protein
VPTAAALPAAGVPEAGAAQSVPVEVGTAVSGQLVAPLMAAAQPLTAAAAAGQAGSRRLMAKGPHRQLLQTCPPANPCLVRKDQRPLHSGWPRGEARTGWNAVAEAYMQLSYQLFLCFALHSLYMQGPLEDYPITAITPYHTP